MRQTKEPYQNNQAFEMGGDGGRVTTHIPALTNRDLLPDRVGNTFVYACMYISKRVNKRLGRPRAHGDHHSSVRTSWK